MNRPAAVSIDFYDLSSQTNWPQDARDVWGKLGSPSPPRLVLSAPSLSDEPPRKVWDGPLTAATTDMLLNSPVRRELARRLLGGDSAVWLLFSSGDAGRDQAARQVLSNALQRAARDLRLPDQEDPGDAEYDMPLAGNIKLKLRFSVLEVARGTDEDRLLRSMLQPMAAERKWTAGPAVVPVFGRGRALDVLIGENAKEEAILGGCEFLSGPCSCQVKEMNPGLDLFVPIDWDGLIGGSLVVDEALPPLVVPRAQESQRSASAAEKQVMLPAPHQDSPNRRLKSGLVIVSALGLLALGLGTWWMLQPGRK